MPSPSRLLALAALLVSSNAIVPPGQKGLPHQPSSDIKHPTTDISGIVQAASQVDQKQAAPIDTPPNVDAPRTTARSPTLTPPSRMSPPPIARAAAMSTPPPPATAAARLGTVFDGLAAGVHDASIQGTAFLTYTVVSNATYNVQACTDWCATVKGCVFVNLYYEFNNQLLDFVFSEKSNLKCAAYGDVHSATEKLNFGGQQSYEQVGNETVPLTFITESSGWATDSLVDPDTPDGYDYVFGPTGGANNAPGYMGFAFLDQYDVDACAQLCNGRGADPNGGGCAYFNIWRAVVNGVPTTYTCSMYYLVADESTAVNFGQGSLVVTLSRGYARKSILPDGGFEGYTDCTDFCFTESYSSWIGTTPSGGDLDATFFFFVPYAHTGHGSALLGAALAEDALSGTIKPVAPLVTDAGAPYVIQCFMASSFSDPADEATAKVDILWNGARVGGVSGFEEYTFVEAAVVGTGSDELAFVGGSAPAWTFIDDCKVYKA